MGLHQALEEKGIEHEILGIDIRDMPNYPFNFEIGDALKIDPFDWDFIWASPPCQAYSSTTSQFRNKGKKYPDLIKQTRKLIKNKSYCIENVISAPLNYTLFLCGTMFGLKLYRHRIFEMNFICHSLKHFPHKGQQTCKSIYGSKEGKKTVKEWQNVMEINWIGKKMISQAIPPAYSKYIMSEFLKKRKGIKSWL